MKRTTKSLALKTETVRALSSNDLAGINGGEYKIPPTAKCISNQPVAGANTQPTPDLEYEYLRQYNQQQH